MTLELQHSSLILEEIQLLKLYTTGNLWLDFQSEETNGAHHTVLKSMDTDLHLDKTLILNSL
jgi:hypothetical protein